MDPNRKSKTSSHPQSQTQTYPPTHFPPPNGYSQGMVKMIISYIVCENKEHFPPPNHTKTITAE